ncbi:hypothetical protein LINPERPRIM_LOCUS44655 [Linum perenne]
MSSQKLTILLYIFELFCRTGCSRPLVSTRIR